MVFEGEHSVISSKEGASLYIVIPMKWARAHGIKKKTKLHYVGNGVLILIPPDEMDNFKKKRDEVE